jgi:hypothetical protein
VQGTRLKAQLTAESTRLHMHPAVCASVSHLSIEMDVVPASQSGWEDWVSDFTYDTHTCAQQRCDHIQHGTRWCLR